MEQGTTYKAQIPYYQILYNSKDITKDISADLIDLRYDDKVGGESDELVIKLNDTRGLWRNSWYPKKGDELQAKIGFVSGKTVNCGVFNIDKVKTSGVPFTVEIRAVASSYKKELRTPKSVVHERKTLRQIAEKTAKSNLLELVGEIAEIKINVETQNRETDLAFLMKLAKRFGYTFSVKGNQLVFISIYTLDEAPAVATVDVSQISSFDICDELQGTFAESEVSYDTLEGVTAKQTLYYEPDFLANDKLMIRAKSETVAQADAMGEAGVYEANTNAITGNLSTGGNPLFLAGNNLNLTGIGANSGKYQIKSSSHKIDGRGGYGVSVEIRKIG